MQLSAPLLRVWSSEDSYRNNEQEILAYYLVASYVRDDGAVIHSLAEDDTRQIPNGAYVLLTDVYASSATLYYSVAPSINRLALWQLAQSGAKQGDIATFDGERWVPNTPTHSEITAETLPQHASRHASYGDDPLTPDLLGAAQLHNNFLAVWQMPSANSLDDLLAGSERWNGWCIEDTYNPPATPTAKQPQLAYADGNGTRWYGEPLRPTKTPLLQIIDSVDKLPTEVCAAILDTVPPKLVLRGSDGLVYDAVGNLLQ